MLGCRLAATALAFCAALAGSASAQPSATEPRRLTQAAEVLALTVDEAQSRLPVTVSGVVTASEPDWQGRFFLQDESGGVFIHHLGKQPKAGDVVSVDGMTSPGAFAPVIHARNWTKTGRSALPAARQVSIESLMAGVEDGQRVEITGLVRAASIAPTQKTMLEVSIGAYRVRVYPKLPGAVDPHSLVAAKVRVRGTAATSFNTARRHLTAVNLFVPRAEDFEVVQPEPHSPFDQPAVKLGHIARYRSGAGLGERMRIVGYVTLQRPGLDLFLEDDTGGLHVETRQAQSVPQGRLVEAVGFLEFINYQPVLKDAVFRLVNEPPQTIVAREVPVTELRSGLHPGEFIKLRGKVLDATTRPVQRENPAFTGARTIFTIQTPELTFSAECEEPVQASAAFAAVAPGSIVDAEGVATLETGDDGKLRSLTLLLPAPESLRVVEKPSWFTPERMVVGFIVVCGLLAGVAGWSLTVSKKNAMLGLLVAERDSAQKDLLAAHEQLEQRVRERTEQLKIEMSARKSAEVEFRAVLTERTRLARELHDTLEQALTGIALQLDTAARLFERDPAEARGPLERARGFLRQSQLELRRSIWDLRSRELEQFDLARALSIAAQQIATGTALQCEIQTHGACERLPDLVEENLLRIGQEALTNVVKHAAATRATVRLECTGDTVTLEIKDNGQGLDEAQLSHRKEGSFGLLGMHERMKRLGGRLDVSSARGEGTTVRAIVSLAAAAARAERTEPAGTII